MESTEKPRKTLVGRLKYTLGRIVSSRKNQTAFAGLVTIIAVPVAEAYCGCKLDPAVATAVIYSILGIAGSVILGISIEDHGRHSGAPRGEAAPPPAEE